MKSSWKTPIRSDFLWIKINPNNDEDPYCVEIQRYGEFKQLKVKQWIKVGHVPREISRHVNYFLQLGSEIAVCVHDTKLHRSLTALKGLEILLEMTFKITSAKQKIIERLKSHIESNYKNPVEAKVEDKKVLKTCEQDLVESDAGSEISFTDNPEIEDEVIHISD
jgi:hypothetical protein